MKKQEQVSTQRGYRLWRKFMTLGEHTGCHQLPERSFFINGYQLPVCARCTGVILGYLAALPGIWYNKINSSFSVFGCLIMLTDWGLQALTIRPSTNKRRLITGILGGYGIMTLQLALLKKIIKLLQH
jgi:uncharacterized membrane protein